jgi:hypothetical protein
MIQYDFQVAEFKDPDTKKIWKVELQVRKTYRDEYNNIIKQESFVTVPRFEYIMKDYNA